MMEKVTGKERRLIKFWVDHEKDRSCYQRVCLREKSLMKVNLPYNHAEKVD
jgi:hypothetical protein